MRGLETPSTEIDFERQVPEVSGRIDALIGRTILELKSNLGREQTDAEEQLKRYLGEREVQTAERYVGIATDGATFIPYELRAGELRRFAEYTPPPDNPRDLLVWLSAVVAVSTDLDTTPEVVTRELGRGSLAWHRALGGPHELWPGVGDGTRWQHRDPTPSTPVGF